MKPRDDLDREQSMLAAFLLDPEVERAVRTDPAGQAMRYGVAVDAARTMASIEPRRVAAFRASQAHKDAVRAGKRPTRI